MNCLLVTLLSMAVASMSVFPTAAQGTALPTVDAQSTELEPPHALPLSPGATAASKPAAAAADAEPLPEAKPLQQLNIDLGEVWQEDDREVLIRNARRAKDNNDGASADCRYTKSPWSDCDQKTNTRSRTLSLKRGADCVPTRTIQKKCKKACRYEKGTWSDCAGGQMSRSDRLKTSSDATCQATRDVTKNCSQNKSKGDKKDRNAKNGKQDKGRKSGRA